jgi:chromatin remodeling complex protein RSC6
MSTIIKKTVAPKTAATKKAAVPAKAELAAPAVVAAPAVAAPAVAAPAKPTKKAAKAAEPVAAVPAAEVAAELPLAPVTVEVLVSELATRLMGLEKEVRATKLLLKKIGILHAKAVKVAAGTKGKRRKERDPNAKPRTPSGFAKPSKITAELATFLSLDPNEEIARTTVIKQISYYIKSHSLENPKNRREIFADAPLRKLFRLDEGAELNYFKLQKFIAPHFIKAVPAVAAAVDAVPTTTV